MHTLLNKLEISLDNLIEIANISDRIYRNFYINYEKKTVKLDKNGESDELFGYYFDKVDNITKEVIKIFYVTYFEEGRIIYNPIKEAIYDLKSLKKDKTLEKNRLDKIEEVKEKIDDIREELFKKRIEKWNSPSEVEKRRKLTEWHKQIKEKSRQLMKKNNKKIIERRAAIKSKIQERIKDREEYQSGILTGFSIF